MVRRLIACAVMALWLVAVVPVAQADTQNIIEPQHEPPTAADGWQAGTCIEDAPPIFCSPETPERFFKTAGGHPPMGFTQYIIQHEEKPGGPFGTLKPIKEPQAGHPITIKTLRADLPPGLTVNPQATPHCSLAEFETVAELAPGVFGRLPSCKPSTIVGRDEVTLVTNEDEVEISPIKSPGLKVPKGFVVPPGAETGTKVPVYNLEPREGEPALLGFVVGFKELIFLKTDVSWESDFHEAFTIDEPEPSHPFSTLKNRLISFGRAGNGTYLTNPTTCIDPNEFPHLYSTWFRAESWLEPNPTFPNGSTPVEAKVEDSSGKLIQQTGCDTVPFEPAIDVAPGTSAIDSPAAATVTTKLPFNPLKEGGEGQSQSHLRRAEVTLPAGMGLNPSGSNGLLACTDAQFKKGVRTYNNECPAASQIGTAEIKSPPLARPLVGGIYVGQQKSSNPASGEEFRILVEAKEPKEGVAVRLVGNTAANPVTGQLTTVFDEQEVGPLAGKLPRGLPQAPFESVALHFDGAKEILTSPPTCAAAESTGRMEPWARPGQQVPVSSKFTLSSDPTGGTCPTTLAARKFAPSYRPSPRAPRRASTARSR
jgi:hypothetical protein